MRGSWRRRCDARAKHTSARKTGKAGPDWRNAFRHCRNWAVPGKLRCHLHGGRSTGPRTPEGKARSLAARLEGRRRRIAELALEGKKINGGHNGRYPKDWPMTPQKRHRTQPPTTHQQAVRQWQRRWAETQAEAKRQKEARRLWRLAFRGA